MSKRIGQVVISCLYKKGDREDIANWQPTSLLKYDNKTYTKVLANNIQPTLEDIIGPEQTAFKKGRTSTENLQLNQNVTSYTNANRIQAAMVALDRLEWNFFFKALQQFGYRSEIIQRITSQVKKKTRHLLQAGTWFDLLFEHLFQHQSPSPCEYKRSTLKQLRW